MAYNLETILAEKFETTINWGLATSRMRDFYDIYILTATQTVNAGTFRAALQKTEESRGTAEQMADAVGVIQMIAESPIMRGLWQRYQKNYSYANDVSWDMAIEALRGLAENAKASG